MAHTHDLWQRLRMKRLGCKFTRERTIESVVVDFYCAEKNLAVCIEPSDENKKTLTDRGLSVLDVTRADLAYDLGGVIDRIRWRIVSSRGEYHVAKDSYRRFLSRS